MKVTCFLFICIFCLSCSGRVTIEGFDQEAWKNDFKGCQSQRIKLSKVLLQHKDELKQLEDDAIAELLGNPEKNEQFSRGKKTYTYYIAPGKQCGDSSVTEGKKLIVEFDALGKPRMIRESLLD